MTEHTDSRDLVITRLIPAAPHLIYRAWTEPALLKQWFAPKPFETPAVELDLRPGGTNRIVMRGPDGTEFPNLGVYLELVPDEKIVFTDAYTSAWVPSAKPFMTVEIILVPEGEGTRYTARVHHWTAEDRQAHIDMGFEQGWGQTTDQLAALVATL